MAEGIVKWFNGTKGYGFIAPKEGSKDIFVHITALEKSGLNELKEGQKVKYEEVVDKGRSRAEDVHLLD